MFDGSDADTNSELQSQSSKELLYSEYMDITDAEHTVKLIESKKISKPIMQFQRSSVLDRVKKLLPLMEQGQRELNKKSVEENNIEVLEGESFVEMNVALHRKGNIKSNDLMCEPEELESNEGILESSSNFEQYEGSSESCESDTESESEDSCISELSDVSQIIPSDNHQHNEKLISVIDEES